MKLCFTADAPICSRTQAAEKGHGRFVQRTCRTSQLLHGYSDFPGLYQAIELRRETTYLRTGRSTCELEYAVTSLAPRVASAAQLLLLLREHWAIENKDFHVRDDSWREDRQVRRNANAAFALHLLSALALNLLRTPSAHWSGAEPLNARAEIIDYLSATRPRAVIDGS